MRWDLIRSPSMLSACIQSVMCVALNDTPPGLICHNAERRKTVCLQHCRYWTTGQRLSGAGAGAVNLTPVDTDLSQNTRASDHRIVQSGYMNDRSGSVVFRCHSQKKNRSTSNHHTTPDSHGFVKSETKTSNAKSFGSRSCRQSLKKRRTF